MKVVVYMKYKLSSNLNISKTDDGGSIVLNSNDGQYYHLDQLTTNFLGLLIEGVSFEEKIAKVSVVGIGLKSHYETTSEIFDTLAENDINIDMISCSEINVSCIIREEDVDKAVNALHKRFIEID